MVWCRILVRAIFTFLNSSLNCLIEKVPCVQFSSECQPNKLPEEEEVVQSLSDCEEQSKTDSEQDVSINWSDYQIYDFDAENTQVAVENERALAICKRKAS